jgi:hypothetical protein
MTTHTDAEAATKYTKVQLPVLVVPEGKRVTFAEVQFQASLSPGQEVELWLVSTQETLPWDEEGAKKVGAWVADKRTGSLVRFDVTKPVLRALESEKTLPVLLVRMSPKNDVVTDLMPLEKAEPKMILHLERE